MTIDDILAYLPDARRTGTGWTAACPSHQDATPSLSLTESEGGDVLVHCFAGCSPQDVVSALGLNLKDLFQQPESTSPVPLRPSPRGIQRETPKTDAFSTLAAYCDVPIGTLIALPLDADAEGRITFEFGTECPRKVRAFPDKRFTWQPAGAPIPPLWPLPSDHLPELIWLCEGETDAIVLRHAGLDAYALTRGAGGTLTHEQCATLTRRGVRRAQLVFDCDTAGRQGAERLAAAFAQSGISVSILDLASADLVDPLKGQKDLRDAWQSAHRQRRSPDEFRTQLEEAVSGTPPFDSLSASHKGSGAEETNTVGYGFCWPEELISSTTEEVTWRWKGYIADGNLTVLAGREKSGKSTLVFSLLSALLRGGDFLGLPTQATNVVYCTEEPPDAIVEKLHRFGLLDAPFRVRLLSRNRVRGRPSLATLVEHAVAEAKAYDAKVIVLDSLAFWAGTGPEQENDAGAMSAAMRTILAATAEGLAVLVVHHVSKKNGDLRGSTAIGAAADLIATLSLDRDYARRRTLETVGRYIAIPPKLAIELDGDTYRALGSPSTVTNLDREQEVIHALPDCEPGLTVEEASCETNLSPVRLSETLRQAFERGHVERTGRGVKGDPYRYWRAA